MPTDQFINKRRRASVSGSRGVALVIVLAFVVLLTGLIIAFFSRSITDRQISNSSVSREKVSTFADGSADAIIGELKQEIVLNSNTNTITTGNVTTILYYPLTPASMLPQSSGTAGITAMPPNLLKISGSGQLFYTGSNGTVPANGVSNASSISTTTGTSLNGRYFTTAYWNQHYLLPTISSTDSTPAPGTFVPPSWIFVARDGSNPTIWNPNMITSGSNLSSVVGRYAFAIYHEGGLLDVNAAGYPSMTGTNLSGYKLGEPYADLTQIGLTGSVNGQIDQLVAWRNFASIPVPGVTPSFLSPGFQSVSASNYYALATSNSTGYLAVTGTAVNGYQTDRLFESRQEMIKFFQNALGVSGTGMNVLNYLTTFSRDLNQPSYIPPVQSGSSAPVVLAASLGGNSGYGGDNLINPSFPATRVQSSFTRNDGSTANVGDPLVNKRFALNRIAWITYKGPSADVIAASGTSDASIQALVTDGIPLSYLQQGTDLNIQKYFGLNWDSTNSRWLYNVHVGGAPANQFIMLVGQPPGTSPNSATYVQDANRDPNFFELLKAGITVGSLGKAAVISGTSATNVPPGYAAAQVPVNLRYPFDTSVDYHIVQIGVNILSEVNPTSYPVRIAFNDGSSRGLWEFQGVTDLPYLSYVFNGVLRTQAPNPAPPGLSAVDGSPYQYPAAQNVTLSSPGSASMIQVPAVWNPYDPNGAQGILRPAKFRVVIDSNDPVSLVASGSDDSIWHGAEAAGSTVPGSGSGAGNQGLAAPGAVYSFNATGAGKTTEKPGGIGSPVSDSVTFTDGTGTLYREPTVIFSGSAPGGATRTAGNFNSVDPNPLPGETDGSMGPWAPLVLGQFPLAFATGTTTYYTGSGMLGLAAGNGDNRVYFTYRLQYEYPAGSGNYITYDTKYCRTTHGLFPFQCEYNQPSPIFTPCVITGPNAFNSYSWAAAIDPRTARFGLISETYNGGRSWSGANAPPGANPAWIFNSGGATTTIGITYPIRQDNSAGFYFNNLDSGNVPSGGQTSGNNFALLSYGMPSTQDIPYPSFAAGWTAPVTIVSPHGSSSIWMFAPGLYAQNNPGAPFNSGNMIEPSYYADADGVVRRAAGAYVPAGSNISASTPVGLPPASIQGYAGAVASLVTPATAVPFSQSQSRPLLLHRPFRSVAELGYVFRDVPWKNLDFFTPESGDAGLLDLFCINETSNPTGLVAGKVNLNTHQTSVLTAIVSGAYVDDPKVTNATVGSLSSTAPMAIANALVARTTDTANYGPLQNLSELVGKWNSAVAISPGVAYTSQGTNWGIDLPFSSGYKDGRFSYKGYSGASSASTGTAENLTDAYAAATFNSNAALSGSLQTCVSQIQRFHEAPIRALTSVGQTRVWNLMIDLVAQTGRYPQSTSNMANFIVEGEQHFWVHVAIDRLTGQVIDKQVEVVKE